MGKSKLKHYWLLYFISKVSHYNLSVRPLFKNATKNSKMQQRRLNQADGKSFERKIGFCIGTIHEFCNNIKGQSTIASNLRNYNDQADSYARVSSIFTRSRLLFAPKSANRIERNILSNRGRAESAALL